MFRTTKLKKAIVLTGIKKNVLCEKCNTTYRQLNYLIESERHKKPQLDTVANAIGLELISQFRIGNQIITAPTFAEMIKELLLIKEIPQTAIVSGTKQNASSKINNGKFSYDELQDIARKCGAIYDERYILDGMEL